MEVEVTRISVDKRTIALGDPLLIDQGKDEKGEPKPRKHAWCQSIDYETKRIKWMTKKGETGDVTFEEAAQARPQ